MKKMEGGGGRVDVYIRWIKGDVDCLVYIDGMGGLGWFV